MALGGRGVPVAPPAHDFPYLRAYSESLRQQVAALMAQEDGLAALLRRKYPHAHTVRTDKALYHYTSALKSRHLRNADAVNKVVFDSKIHVVRHALGLHTAVSRVQGGRLAAKHEIRIAAMFKQVPEEFLRMIVVHELAHLREREHNKAFYQLCEHMEPAYHQYELDVRLYLTHLEHTGPRLWQADLAVAE
ncbi:M48 family metallopeptidase [Giesbergeria anulus]|uniref:YgjP-like metallopeptidase domain-containing protein n=1 Tax=Giesbergeria anulus TaxID=180197 RepID=A0A1H9HRK8_9BURK|nr:YgjP-like metallopeptidase domain-containing protein [Giesbergeria anulus]SEQ64906.1 hypothetical protein SAMN02982919_00897 [Giesbergeria anulus]